MDNIINKKAVYELEKRLHLRDQNFSLPNNYKTNPKLCFLELQQKEKTPILEDKILILHEQKQADLPRKKKEQKVKKAETNPYYIFLSSLYGFKQNWS